MICNEDGIKISSVSVTVFELWPYKKRSLKISLIMKKPDEKCIFWNTNISGLVPGAKLKSFNGMFKMPKSLPVQNFGRKCLLVGEIRLQMQCIMPMGDPGHSYAGSTSVLPDHYDDSEIKKVLFEREGISLVWAKKFEVPKSFKGTFRNVRHPTVYVMCH